MADERDDTEPGRLERRTIHEGRLLKMSVDRVRFPDGSEGELEMVRHPGASAVLPVVGSLDAPDPEVILVRQYRYASGGYLYEVPAGMPEGEEEAWDRCAARELEEETGFRPGTLEPLTHIYTTPGFSDEVIRLYLASELTPGETERDEDEFMEVVSVPFSRAVEMVRSGEIVDCKSVATILYVRCFVLRAGVGAEG